MGQRCQTRSASLLAANGGRAQKAEAARTLVLGPWTSPALPDTLLRDLVTGDAKPRRSHMVPREEDWHRGPAWLAFAQPAKNTLSERGPSLWGPVCPSLWGLVLGGISETEGVLPASKSSQRLMTYPASRWPQPDYWEQKKNSKGKDPPLSLQVFPVTISSSPSHSTLFPGTRGSYLRCGVLTVLFPRICTWPPVTAQGRGGTVGCRAQCCQHRGPRTTHRERPLSLLPACQHLSV